MGTVHFTAQMDASADVTFLMYDDQPDSWDVVKDNQAACSMRSTYARETLNLVPLNRTDALIGISEVYRPRVWYFVVASSTCAASWNVPEFKLELLNDGSQFSMDEEGAHPGPVQCTAWEGGSGRGRPAGFPSQPSIPHRHPAHIRRGLLPVPGGAPRDRLLPPSCRVLPCRASQ